MADEEAEDREKQLKAGTIAKQVLDFARTVVKPGESVLEAAEAIEAKIKELGAQPAFPTGLARNEWAAHCTPSRDSLEVFSDRDLVKVDVGTHIDGMIADTAITLDFSGAHAALCKASEDALNAAIKAMVPGAELGAIGKVIEDTIRAAGFRPIENLTGHELAPGLVHSGVSVPNIGCTMPQKLQVGEVFAIEPFATTGAGLVIEAPEVNIYSLIGVKPVRMAASRNILEHILNEYQMLPFTERWLPVQGLSMRTALKELERAEVIRTYPALREKANGMVAQFEHTVIIEESGARVITA